jgi:hypothetical protein
MRTLLVSALALGAFTSAAVAGPVALTDAQMDTLTAGISQSNDSTVEVTQSNSASVTFGDDAFVGSFELNQNNESSVTVTHSNNVAPPPE